LALVACALACFLGEIAASNRQSAAFWGYLRGRQAAAGAAEGNPDAKPPSEEELASLAEETHRWDCWRQVCQYANLRCCLLSLLLLVCRWSIATAAPFAVCLLVFLQSWGFRIRF
jgi:hypothetical protein